MHPSGKKMSLIQKTLAFILSLILVLLFAVALLLQSSWLKGVIEKQVSEKTGREFAIEGPFRVQLTWPLVFRMERVRFKNPEWAREKEMITAKEAAFSLHLLPLLNGKLIFHDVAVIEPVAHLEIGPKDRKNWIIGGDKKEEGTAPVIETMSVDKGVLTFFHPEHGTDLKLEVSTTADAKGGIRFSASGKYKNLPSKASGTGGSVLAIQEDNIPYPIDARFEIGGTKAAINGTITGLASFAAVDLNLDLGGESMADLYPLLSLALPPTPPYQIRGHLVRAGEKWTFSDFNGKVGDSDLSGDTEVVYRDKRPGLKADLISHQLDMDDLGGFVGAPPQTGPGETASPEQKQEAAQIAASPRALSDKPIKLERLRAMDADVRFSGKSIRSKKTPIEDLKTHLVLNQGQLTLDPLNFGVAGGTVVSKLAIDARKPVLHIETDSKFQLIQLSKLFPQNDVFQEGAGLIGGRMVLSADGNSPADIAASADGTFGLATSGGRISNLLLEVVGLDAAEIVKFFFRGDETVQLRCAVADFRIEEGLMTPNAFVIDTSDTNISVTGTVELGDEALDLKLQPLPKDYSPLSLRSPLHVTGTLKDPNFRPDKSLIIKGGIAAALAALVTPVALLIPLIETGPGENANCTRLVQAVEEHAKTKIP
jgi:AsmA family protein